MYNTRTLHNMYKTLTISSKRFHEAANSMLIKSICSIWLQLYLDYSKWMTVDGTKDLIFIG